MNFFAGRAGRTEAHRALSDGAGRRGSTLINRNVFIGERRTSLRLEPAMWDALAEICRREDMSLHEVCRQIDERRQASSLTAAIRVFILSYFRAAATEEGHASNGHGSIYTRPSRGLARAARRGPGARQDGRPV